MSASVTWLASPTLSPPENRFSRKSRAKLKVDRLESKLGRSSWRFVRHQQVVEPWLDGVGQRSVVEDDGTLEEHAAVEAEAWKQPRRGVVHVRLGIDPVQSVPGEAYRRFRHHEGPGGADRVGEGRLQVGPRPGGARPLIEVRDVRRCTEVRRAVSLREVRLNEDLRETCVGPVSRVDGPVHGQEVLEPDECAPSIAAVPGVEPAWEMRSAALREAGPEILEILRIRDPLDAGICRPPVRPLVPVPEVERCAIVVELRVKRQIVRCDPAGPVGSGDKAGTLPASARRARSSFVR